MKYKYQDGSSSKTWIPVLCTDINSHASFVLSCNTGTDDTEAVLGSELMRL